ncbi:hypothetical protein LA080_011421 [Diaporthe eres]|nr:hypothetical protein LA080_011421 [Diaporthe eres]
MSLFGYPDKKPTNRFCLNPTGKPSTSAKDKPVFIEYERSRAGEYRPFHHARLEGWMYDRYGAKKQPQLSPVRKERYGGLPQGWKFKFMGWSNLTDKGIQDRVDGVWVEYELTVKTEYSL